MSQPPTLGPWVTAWMEKYLVHSDGDYLGQPFRLRLWEKALIYEMYELEPTGRRTYGRALVGFPKGNGKSEIAAAVACAELAGPVVCSGFDDDGRPVPAQRIAPDIPVAAASYDQADIVFGAASKMIAEGPLSDYFDVFEREIRPKDGGGVLYRVAAVAGPNDGKRPSFFVSDELHEWTGNKERVHLVISNGRAKRADSWELNITTAGWDKDTLLGRMYEHGRRIEKGEIDDPRFLFRWWEASEGYDLSDPDQLRAAILEANPGANPDTNGELGPFLSADNVAERYSEIPEFEFRRYHLNQWTTSPDFWIEGEVWDGRTVQREVTTEEPIVLGFDGSYSGDSTALVGCTVNDPHLFVLGHWERPEHDEEWRVDVMDVEARILQVCADYNVQNVGCDPYRWQRSMAALDERGLPIVEWASHLPSRMVPACAQFYDAVKGAERVLTHDGSPDLARHIANCVIKEDNRGPRITKEYRKSPRRIDLAVAAVIAYDLAYRTEPPTRSRYEDPDAEVMFV